MGSHIFTSITANYLPKARVLAHSLKRFHPSFRFHLVLSDATPPGFRLEDEPFDSLIGVADLGIPNLEQWLFKHSLVEVSTGIKGFALLKILAMPDCSEALYFDPDIVVLSPLDGLLREFQTASVLLTPHICEPEDTIEAILDNEFSVLKHGVYNLGFVGVKKSREGLRFAQWWKERLHQFCYDDIPSGIFTDQRWADLVPAYFPDHRVLRDPVYNVSTWNLTHRLINGDLENGVYANGGRVVFYHFSGMDSGAQHAMLDKYGASMPVLYELRSWYLAECDRMGQEVFGKIPWHYATFDSGQPILPLHRKRYRDRLDLQNAFPSPFDTGDVSRSYYHWFEANDESRVKPAPHVVPVAQTPCTLSRPTRYPSGNYRIFLSVSGTDPAIAAVEAEALLRTAYARNQLHLIGPECIVDRLSKDPEIARNFAVVRLPVDNGHAGSFCEVLRRFHDCDFLFLASGVRLPPLGDLRLAWTAYRQEGVATVSPLSHGGADTPFSIEAFPEDSVPALDTIDRACYDCSVFETPELQSFRPGCVYVRSEAARITLFHGISDRDPFGSFLQATLRVRLSHVLADHICTGALARAARCKSSTHEPDLPDGAKAAVAAQSRRVHFYLAMNQPNWASISSALKPRQLHVMHSWGGGLERWVQEYCRTDQAHENFILKSIGTWGAFGMHLHLYRHIDDPQPLRAWRLDPPVKSTAIAHDSYRAALFDIIESLGIEKVMVSSLIGHSLDVLGSGLPTFFICHEFYPFCPALNISFHGVCHDCSEDRLTRCTVENPHNRFFLNVPPSYWPELRKSFADIVNRQACVLIAPSNSVRDHYNELVPELGGRFAVIPHGARAISSKALDLRYDHSTRLRILVLGILGPHKGLALLQEIMPELLKFADLFLIGCGTEFSAPFEGVAGVTLIRQYQRRDLPDILADLAPHVGLLLSVVPETFSFTLQELLELGIPTVCTRVGSFADRIEDGVNGFLCAPDPSQILDRLRSLNRDRETLSQVHSRLCTSPRRSIEEMLEDYRTVASLPAHSGRAYFASRIHQYQPLGVLGRCQLYWRAKEANFDEIHSSAAYFSPDIADHSMRLPIPASVAEPLEFRLDPADRPGAMIVRKLSIKSHQGDVLWSWDGNIASVCGMERDEVEFLPMPDGASGGLFHFTGDDPRFVLPLDHPTCRELRKGGGLEMDYTWFSPGRYASLPVSWARELDRANFRIRERESQISSIREELESARHRVADLECSISWRWSLPLRMIGALGQHARRLIIRPFSKPKSRRTQEPPRGNRRSVERD
jgi:glycosyltransferase involved in cell wall biosynthesis